MIKIFVLFFIPGFFAGGPMGANGGGAFVEETTGGSGFGGGASAATLVCGITVVAVRPT
jgi:hypothetical protein